MDPQTIQKHIDLKAPISRVWKALTDHTEFGRWFGCVLEGPFEVGKTTHGKLSFPGFEHLRWGVDVKKMEAERRFAFTWHPYPADPTIDYGQETPTLVEFVLEATAGGTRLTVTESGFDRIPANRRLEAFRMNTQGWGIQLENIANHVQ